MVTLPEVLHNPLDIQAWVDHYWTEDARLCNECPFQRTFREPRGEFWGTPCSEVVNECAVVDAHSKVNPSDCLAWQQALEEGDPLAKDVAE